MIVLNHIVTFVICMQINLWKIVFIFNIVIDNRKIRSPRLKTSKINDFTNSVLLQIWSNQYSSKVKISSTKIILKLLHSS